MGEGNVMRALEFLVANLHPPKYLSESEFKLSIIIRLISFCGVMVSTLLIWLEVQAKLFTLVFFFFFSVIFIVGLLGTLVNYIRSISESK